MKIRSSRFSILPGEETEIVNPGGYGKALACYLRESLEAVEYEIATLTPEDFGWWIEIFGMPFKLGVAVCRSQEEGEDDVFYCSTNRDVDGKAWSWRHLKRVPTRKYVEELQTEISKIFENDADIFVVDPSF